MATYQTYQSVGNREDLTDVIYNISPTDTPFMSSVGKTKATAVYHEWQTDSLAAASTSNAAVEGADATSATLAPTTPDPIMQKSYIRLLSKIKFFKR